MKYQYNVNKSFNLKHACFSVDVELILTGAIERRSMTSRQHGNKISGSQQSFLTVLQWRSDDSNSDNSNSPLTRTKSDFPWISPYLSVNFIRLIRTRVTRNSPLTWLSNDGRKAWATILFQSAIMHRKVIRVIFFRFFLPYLRDHGILRSRNFDTMATWRNDFSSLQYYIIARWCDSMNMKKTT